MCGRRWSMLGKAQIRNAAISYCSRADGDETKNKVTQKLIKIVRTIENIKNKYAISNCTLLLDMI